MCVWKHLCSLVVDKSKEHYGSEFILRIWICMFWKSIDIYHQCFGCSCNCGNADCLLHDIWRYLSFNFISNWSSKRVLELVIVVLYCPWSNFVRILCEETNFRDQSCWVHLISRCRQFCSHFSNKSYDWFERRV